VVVWGLLVLLWLTASPIGSYPGWKKSVAEDLSSGVIGLMLTLPLFVIPCASQLPKAFKQRLGLQRCLSESFLIGDDAPKNILDWDAVKEAFQWEIIFVFGGGSMLARRHCSQRPRWDAGRVPG